MKYAIISDIHGNSLALRAVLEDGKNKNVDRFLFCGDYFMSDGDPNDAVTQLKNTPNSVIISGNHEGYLRKLENTDPADWVSPQFAPLYQSFRTLTQENRRYLETLPEYADIEDGEIELHMAHKSTVFFGDAEMREYSSLQFLKKYENRPYSREIFLRDIQEYLERDLEFLQTLDTICAGIYIFGHTHVQWHAKIGDTLFINPGACGCPLDFQQGAAYTLLEVDGKNIRVEERRVSYDTQQVVEKLEKNFSPEAVAWRELLIQAFQTARETVRPFLAYAEEYAVAIGDGERPFSEKLWTGAYNRWKQRPKK